MERQWVTCWATLSGDLDIMGLEGGVRIILGPRGAVLTVTLTEN